VITHRPMHRCRLLSPSTSLTLLKVHIVSTAVVQSPHPCLKWHSHSRLIIIHYTHPVKYETILVRYFIRHSRRDALEIRHSWNGVRRVRKYNDDNRSLIGASQTVLTFITQWTIKNRSHIVRLDTRGNYSRAKFISGNRKIRSDELGVPSVALYSVK